MKRTHLCKSILFTALFSMLWFTGCQFADKPSKKNPVTLTMWHNFGGDMQASMDTLIDEFNETVGKEKGIIINVTAISSSGELNESLSMIAGDEPGAPDMPDICTAYPKVALPFYEKDMLVDFGDYMTSRELAAYVPAFLQEGHFSTDGLYVFPLAKSTEILYVNQTLFDRFAAETGADMQALSTFEGIAELSQLYYDWTGGKAFFCADSWFHIALVGTRQLGEELFQEEKLSLETPAYSHILRTLSDPLTTGGFTVYDGYSSDLSKTGEIVCSTGSSAGILFFGDRVTYADNTSEPVTYTILPYPTFAGGEKLAIQRGGGLMVKKSEPEKEYAACEFIKWLTACDQNMRFVSSTGYLPVTVEALHNKMSSHMETVTDPRIKSMLQTVTSMYEDYQFFPAPNFDDYDAISKAYESDFNEKFMKN